MSSLYPIPTGSLTFHSPSYLIRLQLSTAYKFPLNPIFPSHRALQLLLQSPSNMWPQYLLPPPLLALNESPLCFPSSQSPLPASWAPSDSANPSVSHSPRALKGLPAVVTSFYGYKNRVGEAERTYGRCIAMVAGQIHACGFPLSVLFVILCGRHHKSTHILARA